MAGLWDRIRGKKEDPIQERARQALKEIRETRAHIDLLMKKADMVGEIEDLQRLRVEAEREGDIEELHRLAENERIKNELLQSVKRVLAKYEASQNQLKSRDNATVALEQGISLGRRGAEALERGNLSSAANAFKEAANFLQEAMTEARDKDMKAAAQANLHTVQVSWAQARLQQQEAAAREIVKHYNSRRYDEAVAGYGRLVQDLEQEVAQDRKEGLSEIIGNVESALTQARNGLETSLQAKDSAQVQALAMEARGKYQQAEGLFASHDYIQARELLVQTRTILEEAEALAEQRKFTDVLDRLASQRRQADALREEVIAAIRGGVPVTQSRPLDFGTLAKPSGPVVQGWAAPPVPAPPRLTPQDPVAAFRDMLLATAEGRRIAPDLSFNDIVLCHLQTADESARPYLQQMWEMHFLAEQDIGKIAVIKGREPEFLAWLAAQSDVAKVAVQELRRLPSVTADDLLRVLNRFLGGPPQGKEMDDIRQRATRTVQQARTGFPPQLLSVFDRPVPLLRGVGGFAVVFRAYHRSLAQEVAVKVPAERTPEAGRVFINEASLWADLSHPGIVPVLDHSALPFPYLAMEYMAGGDLQRRLADRGSPFAVAEACRVLLPIAGAVRYAHEERQIIHGDIKASNILLTADGKPKLADWGLSRRSGAASRLMPAYTLEYVAPEQLRNERRSFKTDVYHLGCVLYHLTTGKAPFAGADGEEHLRAMVLDGPAPKPSAVDPSLRPLDDLMVRCMARDPTQRPTIAEVCDAMSRLSG